MVIVFVLIYLYGVAHVGMWYKHLFKKHVPLWGPTMKPKKTDYVVALLAMLTWPALWVMRLIEFHLGDGPYSKS